MNTTQRLNDDLVEEMRLLSLFNLESMLEGLQVHHTAGDKAIAAMGRLHGKGLVTEPDGGYLTDLGRTAAEHVQAALLILA